MNRPITSAEFETAIYKFPANKCPGPDGFTGKVSQIFREELVGCHFLLQGIFLTLGLNPYQLHWQVDSLPLSHQGSHPSETIQKKKKYRGRNIPKFILWGHHHHDAKTEYTTKNRKLQVNKLINIDAKFLNKILANEITSVH